MHAQTMVTAKGGSVSGKLDELKQQCPTCSQRVVVTNGDTNTRVAWDNDDERFGFRGKAEYFDCDMNIAKGKGLGLTNKQLLKQKTSCYVMLFLNR